MDTAPDMGAQQRFWDDWNDQYRHDDRLDDYCRRQADVATAVAATLVAPRILEVGCGTGWLSARLRAYGRVTGTDLSPSSIERARSTVPDGVFSSGDFLAVDLDPPYDLVVTADVLSHVTDQQAFVDRVAEVLRPGGKFVLMTQNGFVWRRSSNLAPQGAGQVRNWPPLSRIKELLAASFTIDHIGSIFPGGDRGILRVTRIGRGLCSRLGLGTPATRLLEAARVGRELTIVATRR